MQPLANGLGVERSNDDITMLGLKASIYDCKITTMNASPLHAFTQDSNQINMRRPDAEKLIEGNVLLDVIRCRRGETC
ncbi:Unknown protein sequence [Pseudomonas amygdali pv. morsprunorum]|uniref:Uncharacterized protein n=1 Tax=Pseudomonas amygdali pv. tabaci TaxID=322 RepID=A0AAX1VNY6_PSEAJ|nr:hypothetical protein A3SK_0102340 [Pseudomonas amygdali pv. tabaci str. 6605]KPC56111.1 Unknown protein sequence [Pseudomonas amygdali pv. morsprunorum]RML76160.1 hypothetical protein ALQ89_100791 [Pseudomonas amygdali pv. tabaci]BCS45133.1 hypothetical protein Pta6605_34640 [Pseudomonas amygdali pv. tabaci]